MTRESEYTANEQMAEQKPEKVPSVPYPEFCRHPDKCAGLSYCPRDPTCAD